MTTDLQPKPTIVKCPHCGWEYLPCEIFYPNQFLGDPETLIRDALGKIIYTEFKPTAEPTFTESYICNNCNSAFLVDAHITYKVKAEREELNFAKTSVGLLD